MPTTPLPDALLAAARTGYVCVAPGGSARWEVQEAAGALGELIGCSESAALLGTDVLGLAHAGDVGALEGLLVEVSGQPTGMTRPLRLQHQRGHKVWCVVTAAEVSTVAGGVGLLLRPLDRLELEGQSPQRFASELLGQEAFFRRIVATVNDGLLVNDPSGAIIFLNHQAASLLGYTPEAMMGRPILDFMDAEEQRATRARLASRKGGAEEVFDCRWLHREGHAVWTQTSAQPLVDAHGHHLGSLVALSDITARKQAEASLQQLTEELEARVEARTEELAHEVAVRRAAEQVALAASRSKSAFLANMSHELRTPLNAIIGYVELLMEDLEEVSGVDEQTQDDLRRIRHSATHLLELISGILDLSRVEAGHVALEVSRIELSGLLKTLVESVAPLAQRRGNALQLELDPALPALDSDAVKLRQILLNGFSNAAKFTEQGTITLRGTWDAEASQVVLQVEDTGEGISASALTRIFEPFTQEDSSSTRRFDGAGLGLAISRQFAELLGGTLTLHSVKHEGTIFTLRLPLSVPALPVDSSTP